MRTHPLLPLLLLSLGLALGSGIGGHARPSAAEPPAPAAPRNFAEAVLARVQVGPVVEFAPVTLFALQVPDEPGALAVNVHTGGSDVTVAEPEFPARRYDVGVRNGSDRPTLLMGGSVFTGGTRDRMVIHDVIAPAGLPLDVPTLPASSSGETRRAADPFRMLDTVAPTYLRRRARLGSASLVPTFVTHFFDFR